MQVEYQSQIPPWRSPKSWFLPRLLSCLQKTTVEKNRLTFRFGIISWTTIPEISDYAPEQH